MEFALHHKRITDSTSRDALAGRSGDVFTADEQTAGRGRLDHKWHSRAGANLMMSVVLDVAGAAIPEVITLPLVVGAAVRRAIGGAIKWPNDILVAGRKIAGILCERHGESVIAGIGVNVNETRFPGDIADRATSLALLFGAERSVAEVRDAILAELGSLYELWRREGFAAIHSEIAAHDILRGQSLAVMRVDDDPEPARGVCGGIAPDGSLVVAGENIYAGEAHVLGGVRPAAEYRAVVAFGSNLEPRREYLERAASAMAALPGTRLERMSSIIETRGVDVPAEFADRDFLNAVAVFSTRLPALEFSRRMHAVEDALGRVRAVRNGPRTIDLDLIDFSGLVSRDAELTLPHPRFREREFVMRPLAELGLATLAL